MTSIQQLPATFHAEHLSLQVLLVGVFCVKECVWINVWRQSFRVQGQGVIYYSVDNLGKRGWDSNFRFEAQSQMGVRNVQTDLQSKCRETISKVGDMQGKVFFLFFLTSSGCKQIQHFGIKALLQRGLLYNTCSVKDKLFTPQSPKSHEIEMRVMNKCLRPFMVTACDPVYLDSTAANVKDVFLQDVFACILCLEHFKRTFNFFQHKF